MKQEPEIVCEWRREGGHKIATCTWYGDTEQRAPIAASLLFALRMHSGLEGMRVEDLEDGTTRLHLGGVVAEIDEYDLTGGVAYARYISGPTGELEEIEWGEETP